MTDHEEDLLFYGGSKSGVSKNQSRNPKLPPKNPGEFLNNLYPLQNLIVDKRAYKTVEHAYQGLKWKQGPPGESHELKQLRDEYADIVGSARTGSQSFMLSRFVTKKKKGDGVYVKVPPYEQLAHIKPTVMKFYNNGLRKHTVTERRVLEIMQQLVDAKFNQDEDLKRRLLQTGNRRLVEHTAVDSFWGDGGDGSGKNHLGECLMRTRNNLR